MSNNNSPPPNSALVNIESDSKEKSCFEAKPRLGSNLKDPRTFKEISDWRTDMIRRAKGI